MRKMFFRLALLASAAVLSGGPAMAETTPAPAAATPADPFEWLEEWTTPRAMDWVRAHNAVTEKRLTADPRYAALERDALAVLSDKDRIPAPRFLAGRIYNFWQDEAHPRGIWRRTSLEDYAKPAPDWETVLDIDALNKAEGKSFVWKGAACLPPDETRCLISLSDGGEDAVEVREFDPAAAKFVEGGFRLPKGKQQIDWLDADHLLVSSEWQPGEMTASGYPFVIKRLARGQDRAAAVEVFRGKPEDTLAAPQVLRDAAGNRLALVVRAVDFFHSEFFVIGGDAPRLLGLPAKATIEDMVAGRVIVRIDEAWKGTSAGDIAAGTLVSLELADVVKDPAHLRPTVIWTPSPTESLEAVTTTKDQLVIATLDSVRGRISAYAPRPGGGWARKPLALPDNLAVSLGSADSRSNRLFVSASGFTTPSSVYLADAREGSLAPVKTLQPKFDATGLVVEQRHATAPDGTKIPYFLLHKAGVKPDGSTPLILEGYGGFQVSSVPFYSGVTGKLWFERGGAYAMANIRGGGEFGPAWHEAALKTKREVAWDDFTAVARDLIASKVTSPRRLGIAGGSNGGLLTGAQFTRHPDLFRAVAIEVPLLDMIRIGKIAAGASWVGEYGDVDADPAVRAFWQRTSPYHALKAGVAYPEPFLFTTTKDDRVGPQHARKFAAKMEAMGLPFVFYENTEGGHGAGADFRQTAKTQALIFTYFTEKLMD